MLIALALACGWSLIQSYAAEGTSKKLRGRVTLLERACVPQDTGGGVTQCTQPSLQDAAPSE